MFDITTVRKTDEVIKVKLLYWSHSQERRKDRKLLATKMIAVPKENYSDTLLEESSKFQQECRDNGLYDGSFVWEPKIDWKSYV